MLMMISHKPLAIWTFDRLLPAQEAALTETGYVLSIAHRVSSRGNGVKDCHATWLDLCATVGVSASRAKIDPPAVLVLSCAPALFFPLAKFVGSYTNGKTAIIIPVYEERGVWAGEWRRAKVMGDLLTRRRWTPKAGIGEYWGRRTREGRTA